MTSLAVRIEENHEEMVGGPILFMGTTPNIGTTIVSFAAAWDLAVMTRLRVGYICLNLKSSKIKAYLNGGAPAFTLDHLRPFLKNGLNGDRLRCCCQRIHEAGQLFVLFGNAKRDYAEYYQPEEIAHLLQAAQEAFDLVVVEVNAYRDNAASLYMLYHASQAVMVTGPGLQHCAEDYMGWVNTADKSRTIDSKRDWFAYVNQMEPSQSWMLKPREIARRMNLQLGGAMPRYPWIDEYLQFGRLADLMKEKEDVLCSIRPLTAQLLASRGLAIASPEYRRHRWLPRMKMRLAMRPSS